MSDLRSLIASYQTDEASTYHSLRYHVRKSHEGLLRRIADDHGDIALPEIKARLLLVWHKEWSAGGTKVAIGHAFMGQLRTLFSFGMTMLEDSECERLSVVMSKLRFPSPKPRTERLTADQAIAIRKYAHSICWPEIALAQALQFELMLRQKDVIGEWVPMDEPGDTDLAYHGKKWLRGLRWEEVDASMVLSHTTSKRGKPLVVDLKLAPMVMEEIALYGDHEPTGPIIICSATGLPFMGSEFRRKWRIVADGAGIPKDVRNMDSRAGGISEATDAGADLEHVRHAATHSNIAMTQKYSRGSIEKVAGVMQRRVEHRNKNAAQ